MKTICQCCDKETTHEGPCDGFGYKGNCSMCTEFVHRTDGTLIHDDGTVWVPVEVIQQVHYKVQLEKRQQLTEEIVY